MVNKYLLIFTTALYCPGALGEACFNAVSYNMEKTASFFHALFKLQCHFFNFYLSFLAVGKFPLYTINGMYFKWIVPHSESGYSCPHGINRKQLTPRNQSDEAVPTESIGCS